MARRARSPETEASAANLGFEAELWGAADTLRGHIESANPVLRGILPRDYTRPALDKARLGQLVDRFSNLGLGGKGHQAKDTLGTVYQYFLDRFASAEGRRGGEFYTPKCVVRLLVA